MRAHARNSNAHSRTGSLSAANCDTRPPVIAHKRNSSLTRRPTLASATATLLSPPPSTLVTAATTTRNTSVPKGKKNGGAKPHVPPVSAAAKRVAAKGTSLRTRLPYLRPNATPQPSMLTEVKDQLPPRPPHRSFSSSVTTQGSAPWHKASYTVIPETLQQVKKICAASKYDKEGGMVPGGVNVRERHASRTASVSSGKGSDVSEEAAAVIQNIEVTQGMLFSSLQTSVAVEALTPLSPRRGDGVGGATHFQRSKSCNSQLESPLIPSASGLFLSRKDRRKAWSLLLQKQTHVFPILVNAAHSPLATRETKVGATILTFLYNVLRHMTGERQRKAVLRCEKLGLIHVCTAILQENRRRLRFGAAASATRASCLRACEAAGLLFTLCHTFNVKLSAVFRLSQSLDCTLACAYAVFAMLEVDFASFQLSVLPDGLGGSIREAVRVHADAHTRKGTLKLLRAFQAGTQWSVTAFAHFCFTLFVFTDNASSAKELGTRGAELAARAIAMTTYFLSQVTPVFLSNVVYDEPEDRLYPAVGPLVAIDRALWVPAWVVKLLRHVELMLLWCVALLHRLGSCDKVQSDVAAVALHSHVPRGCLVFLAPPIKAAVQLAPRRECVHVVLLLLNTLLDADRAGVLTDLNELGGLKSLVTSILALSEPAAQQWHHYYVQLATMYGCLRLPAIAGQASCYVDQRIPSSLRRLHPSSESAGDIVDAFGPKDGECRDVHRAEGSGQPQQQQQRVSSCAAAPALGGGVHTKPDMCHVPSQANMAATQCLTPAEKLAGLPGATLNPQPPYFGGVHGDLEDGLLLVDTKPSLFSPELHEGAVDPASALAAFAEGTPLPWPFTEAGPPTTAEYWQGKSSHIRSVADDDHLSVPLTDVSQGDRVRVLRHHIARLARLDEAACDSTGNPHAHTVVFERRSSASPQAAKATDSAVQRSHDGIDFFSDYESGNLQRAVEVADNEFDLVLAWDTATNSYTQWFNFGVRNYTPGKTYHFNILNMEKLGSTFNEGQKPLMLHVPDTGSPNKEMKKARPPHWQRTGHNIFYFRNTYERPARAHFFPKDMEIGNGPAMTGVSEGRSGGGVESAHTTPTASAPPRFSPVRPIVCSSAPRLSPSRAPQTPPPATAKGRTPAATATPPPIAYHHHHTSGSNSNNNNAANSNTNGGDDDGDNDGKKQKNYFTLTFSVKMPSEAAGRVYLANCFPFTYTELRGHLSWLAAQEEEEEQQQRNAPHHRHVHALRAQSLCTTPGGLQVPLLTVTALHRRDTADAFTAEEIRRRPIALLVARVHPGETNASWVMQGLLDALLRPTAATAAWSALLCENFVFKIVPMLNVDGVMMGNHRCSFAGMDMNRDYTEPKAELNPTLYALKQLLRYWQQEEGRQAVMFADFHGHSRAKNFLVYGCTSETIRSVAKHLGKRDNEKENDNGSGGHERRRRARVCQMSTDAPLGPEKFLAALLNCIFPSFSLSQSSYAVTKDKVSSARVVLYDEFDVRMSYGFEATMVGGRLSVPNLLLPLAGAANTNDTLWKEEVHYSPAVFRAMGDAFIRGFAVLSEQWLAVAADAAARNSSNNNNNNSSSSEKMQKSGGDVRHDSAAATAETIQMLWSATAAAGSGRDAPEGRPEEFMKEAAAPPEPRAGPYACATRSDRRQGNTASASSASTTTAGAATAQRLPAVSAAGQLDALRYLFLADQREAAAQQGGDDDEQLTIDGSELSSAVGESDTEVHRAVSKAAKKGKATRKAGSDADERSPSSAPSDSGSDDHDWSGFNSETSGADDADDIDVECSSTSSVEEDIPTNLFM